MTETRRVPLLGFLLLSLLLTASPGWADKEKARDHFKKGMAAYTLDDFETAIAEFERGFREEPDPVFLYNIAQAQRMRHRPAQALDFYRKYLRVVPDASNRADVVAQMAALEKMMGNPTEALTPSAVKIQPTPDGNRPPETSPPAPSPTVHPAAAPIVADVTPSPARRRSRTLAGVVIGVVAGVAIVGGVTAGAVVATRDPASMTPLQDARGLQ